MSRALPLRATTAGLKPQRSRGLGTDECGLSGVACLGSQAPESQSGFRALRAKLPRSIRATHRDVADKNGCQCQDGRWTVKPHIQTMRTEIAQGTAFMCKKGKQTNYAARKPHLASLRHPTQSGQAVRQLSLEVATTGDNTEEQDWHVTALRQMNTHTHTQPHSRAHGHVHVREACMQVGGLNWCELLWLRIFPVLRCAPDSMFHKLDQGIRHQGHLEPC